jgi:hypothetical protein
VKLRTTKQLLRAEEEKPRLVDRFTKVILMKYLSGAPFSSKPATQAYRDNFDAIDFSKPSTSPPVQSKPACTAPDTSKFTVLCDDVAKILLAHRTDRRGMRNLATVVLTYLKDRGLLRDV